MNRPIIIQILSPWCSIRPGKSAAEISSLPYQGHGRLKPAQSPEWISRAPALLIDHKIYVHMADLSMGKFPGLKDLITNPRTRISGAWRHLPFNPL
jgi:hypothetical protein